MSKKTGQIHTSFSVAGFSLSFEDRLSQVAAMAGGVAKASEACGVSRNTFYSWVKGAKMPLDAALKLAGAAGVTLDWIATGYDRRPGLPEPSFGTPPPLHADLLKASIELVEDWLEENDREMEAAAKADIVSKIYQLLLEDSASGSTTVDQAKVKQFLRLVT